MKRLVIAAMMIATPALAAKPSLLCKAKDVGTMFTVIATGKGTILFQIDAGEYLDGQGTVLDNGMVAIIVNGGNGDVYMVVDPKKDDGLVKLQYNDGRVYQHPIHCVYR
jgi:hypothetical protein